MGIKTLDVNPIGNNGPTAVTPMGKEILVKVFAINRTDTASVVKCVLPSDATIIDMKVFTNTASDAGTSATISVGINGGSSTYFLNTVDVKTASGKIVPTSKAANFMNLENTPLGPDLSINGMYAESGAASTVGGPFYVVVEYVR